MDWSERVRTDWARPEVPTSRQEVPFLVIGPAVVIGVAQLSDPGSAFTFGLLLVPFAAFAARGLVTTRLPAELFAALVLVPVVLAVADEGALEVALFLTVLATLYTSWHLGSTTRAVLITLVNGAAPLALARWWAPEAEIGWTAWTAANLFTFFMGRSLRQQQALIERLEAAQQALAEQAVADERRRIARELHDLAGHTLAAMLLHVTGARHVLRRDVDDAEQALRDAEAVGRASLDQIRTTVAALRTHERGTDPALGGTAEVGAVVQAYRHGGLVIDATVAPAVADVTGPAGLALHRITREALANVARHAPANRVTLRLELADGDARLAVVDHGAPAAPPVLGTAHFGLVGMRERAESLGGELHAGPTADGWSVTARVPLAVGAIAADAGGPGGAGEAP